MLKSEGKNIISEVNMTVTAGSDYIAVYRIALDKLNCHKPTELWVSIRNYKDGTISDDNIQGALRGFDNIIFKK